MDVNTSAEHDAYEKYKQKNPNGLSMAAWLRNRKNSHFVKQKNQKLAEMIDQKEKLLSLSRLQLENILNRNLLIFKQTFVDHGNDTIEISSPMISTVMAYTDFIANSGKNNDLIKYKIVIDNDNIKTKFTLLPSLTQTQNPKTSGDYYSHLA